VRKQLAHQIRKSIGESEFANRLIEIAAQIERDFQGDEQTRLLELVRETLDRHLEVRENSKRAHVALKRLESDQKALLKLFNMIAKRPQNETLH
jgi:hypothetical protein